MKLLFITLIALAAGNLSPDEENQIFSEYLVRLSEVFVLHREKVLIFSDALSNSLDSIRHSSKKGNFF